MSHRAPAWAFCLTIFTSSRIPGLASAARPGTNAGALPCSPVRHCIQSCYGDTGGTHLQTSGRGWAGSVASSVLFGARRPVLGGPSVPPSADVARSELSQCGGFPTLPRQAFRLGDLALVSFSSLYASERLPDDMLLNRTSGTLVGHFPARQERPRVAPCCVSAF